jgi:hypothetical protein
MTFLEQCKQMAERATRGPWNIQLVDTEETCWLDGEFGEILPTIHDLNFIDFSRQAVPELVSRCKILIDVVNEYMPCTCSTGRIEDCLKHNFLRGIEAPLELKE